MYIYTLFTISISINKMFRGWNWEHIRLIDITFQRVKS